MPRYTFRTSPVADTERGHALDIATKRFPEIHLEDHGADDDMPDLQVWVCRAPNLSHLQRWATAAGIELADVGPYHTRDGEEPS